MSEKVLPPISAYSGDLMSLLGRKISKQGSTLGRDLQHLMKRGCRTTFLFPLKNPDFVWRKCPEADTCGQGHCVMEKHSVRPVCSKISQTCA